MGGQFSLSVAADLDLDEIATFSRERWSDAQAVRYLRGLDQVFNMLAALPYIGTACEEIAPGLRFFPYVSHKVFYEIEPNGDIFVLRVLHESRMAELHLGEHDQEG